MVSTEEIDWVLDQLGYYIILDGGINLFPNMDNYWKIEDFFYLSPQSDEDIIIENSEADGKTWYFDTKEFESYIDYYVDELILESHQDYIFRKFLYDIYMPKYYENEKKKKEIKNKKIKAKLNEKEMYQFCYDNYDEALKFVEVFLDCFVNADNPTMNFFGECITCFDWYNVGREIILGNICNADDVEYIYKNTLENNILIYIKQIYKEILSGAIEYSDNNEIYIV